MSRTSPLAFLPHPIKSFELDKHALCGGKDDLPLRIDVFDWDKNTQHDLIGQVETTFAQLVDASCDAW